MQTRSGRTIRAPVNEYTSRQYIPGSRFVGADHYDRQYSMNSSIPTPEQEEEEKNEYDFYDGFLENDYETDSEDSDYVPSEPTEDEDYNSESENEDDSDYKPSESCEEEEYDSDSEDDESDSDEEDGYNTPTPIQRQCAFREPPPIRRHIPSTTHPWRDESDEEDDVNINVNTILDSETESNSDTDTDLDSDEEPNVTINLTINIGTINMN